MRTRLLLLLLLLCAAGAFGLDFSVSPNRDGSVDVSVSHDWEYTGNLYASVSGDYRNISSDVRDESIFVVTTGTVLALGSDVLGYRVRRADRSFGIAANLQWEKMQIREIGYVDTQAGTKRFFLNDRALDVILPRVVLDLSVRRGGLRLGAGGEYSPWLWVGMDQTLTFTPTLDGERFASDQSASNAFSFIGEAAFVNAVASPRLELEYDRLAITYNVLTLSGPTTVDAVMQTLEAGVSVAFDFITLGNVSPTVSISRIWDWTTDRSNPSARPHTDTETNLGFGFQL